MENYSVDELSEIFCDAILSETFLNKQTLQPRITALIKRFVDLKNVPKNYNAYTSASRNAKRLRTIEQRAEENKFWISIVKELAGEENMQQYYKRSDENLILKGFRQ